jgi:hypothetical protein
MNGWLAEKVGKCVHGGRKKKPPSLRRHYPVQVLRVLSQPNRPARKRECFSTPGTLENRFSAGNTKIRNWKLFFSVKLK